MSDTNALPARDRIKALTDENSFVEIGAAVTSRSTDFNMLKKSAPSDGVITGYGLIRSRPVFIYSQDVSVLNGTVGEMHAKKIAHIYELAIKTGVPVIGLIDCAGMRLQESCDALAAFGQIYRTKARASGIVPQISAIFGRCGGGTAVMAAMSDFIFMEKEHAELFINSPNTLDDSFVGRPDTSHADFQREASVVDVFCEGEEALLTQVRELMQILPENNNDIGGLEECMDDLNRLVPDLPGELRDPALALEDLGDNNFFLELKKGYAPEMVTGFISLDGMTVGCVANRTALCDENGEEKESFAARLTAAGCDKAASFVRRCDAFRIPILSLTNVEGFATTVEEERTVAARAAALTAAFIEADVPKVNLITEKAYGTAYITMNSKHIGADMVFALPDAQIGMMDPKVAAKIMYADDRRANLYEKAEEFAAKSGTEAAAARGYIDSVIEPQAARKQLLFAFELLFTKSGYPIGKKHGTI